MKGKGEDMKRITGWDKGNGYMLKCFEAGGCPDMDTKACVTCEYTNEAWRRFAAYEDTGLTPKEVAELVHKGLQAALDKLAEYESTGLTPAECAELAKTKAEGRLFEIPEWPIPISLGEIADRYRIVGADWNEKTITLKDNG